MQSAKGTPPHSSTILSDLASFCLTSWSLTREIRMFFASSTDACFSSTTLGCRSGWLNFSLDVMTNVTFCLDNIRMALNIFKKELRSLDSSTPSALSRTNVTCVLICLLQSLSHCSGFSGTCEWILLQESIISVATSLTFAFVTRLQNKTVPSFSGLANNSWATSFATVVFPKPGPPVIRTTPTVPFFTNSLTCCISCVRPKIHSSGILSGRQLRSSDITSPSSLCSLVHCSICSSTLRVRSWSMASVFRSCIFMS